MKLGNTIASLSLILSMLPLASAGDVLVVDAGGGPGTYPWAQLAVDAAVDGDVILIRDDSFSEYVVISGKGVTLIGDGNRANFVEIVVSDIASDQAVTLRNVGAGGDIFEEIPPLVVSNCQGCVILEDVRVSSDAAVYNDANPTLVVIDSDRVSIMRAHVTGRPGAGGGEYYGIQGGDGLVLGSSNVAVYDCVLRGGAGGSGLYFLGIEINSTFGGTGSRVSSNAQVLYSGCTILGGDGGDGTETGAGLCDIPHSSGGHGIWIPSGDIEVLGTRITAGLAGAVPDGCTPTEDDGDVINISTGSATTIEESARSFALSSPVREGGTVRISVSAEPGDFAFVVLSTECLGEPVDGFIGTLLPGPTHTAVPLGTLPATGAFDLAVPLPTGFLPIGCDALNVYGQLAVRGSPGSEGILSGGSVLTVVAEGL